MPDVKRVVLAYSGGLDTSVILRWLIETYRCDVVAFCADLGQGEELIPIRDKARKTGAVAVHVVDLRETFVRDFILPMLRANAVYEGAYLLGTSIARPLIAQAQVEIALKEHADAVAHGATGKGNDQVRFELTYAALAPQLTVIAPWREWTLNSRSALMDFARHHDIPVPVTAERPYSTDRNLFHISYEGGILEDPWAAPPDKMFQLTQSPEAAPDVPIELLVDFEHGDPVAVDGRRMGPVDLLTMLNRIGGEHGIARAARAADADGRVRAGRHRHGAPRALQGQRHRGRPPVAALALPAGLRHVRSRYRLSPARRRGLHQPQRAPAEDPLATRPPGLSVRVDVAVTPDGLDRGAVAASTVLVIDVLRASTCIVTALANGCAGIVPVGTPEEARVRQAALPGALVAGERRGEPLEGFDLGNSPLEFTRARVGGRAVIMTTSNGTRALLAARGAAAIGVAAFVNLGPAAAWALAGSRDVLLLCSGERGARSLEDHVCAGLLAERLLAGEPGARATAAAEAATAAARPYGKDIARLAHDSSWARHLASRGRAADVAACLSLDAAGIVPVYRADIDKVVAACG